MLDLAREVDGAHPDRLDLARSTAIRPSTRSARAYWGNVNPIGPRACYDEGKRCAEALAVSYARQYGVEVRIARIFNTYGPRMHENDGRVVSNFVVQALRNEPITDLRRGRADALVLLRDRPDRGVRAPDGQPARRRSGQPRQPARDDGARAGGDRSGGWPNSKSEIVRAPLPKDDPTRRKPDISRAQQLLGDWAPARVAGRGAGRDDRRLQAALRERLSEAALRASVTDGVGRGASSGSPVIGWTRPGRATSASGMRTNGRSSSRGWGTTRSGGWSMTASP